MQNLKRGPVDAMNKKQRKEAARQLILSHKIGERFSSDATIVFGRICGYEFEWVERVAPKVGTAPAVYASWPDGDYVGSWSWVRSIDGYDENKSLTIAMWHASRLGTFRSVRKDRCAVCGSMDRLTVDHKTTPFSVITELFIDKHGKPPIKNVDFGWELVDQVKFLAFHDQLADYQVLCASCNASKGIKQR